MNPPEVRDHVILSRADGEGSRRDRTLSSAAICRRQARARGELLTRPATLFAEAPEHLSEPNGIQVDRLRPRHISMVAANRQFGCVEDHHGSSESEIGSGEPERRSPESEMRAHSGVPFAH